MNPTVADPPEALTKYRTRESLPSLKAFESLIGSSAEHREWISECARLVHVGVRDVLLVGPPGSGKAHMARCMHNAGPRSAEAFLTVDCSALAPSALELDLFGRAADGPFQPFPREGFLQLAGAGTLFLRRVDLLPAALQPQLFEVLRTRRARPLAGGESYEVRCAITVSAGLGFEEMVETGRFSRDLFALFERPGPTPSLRARGSDLELLAAQFVMEAAQEEEREAPTFAVETLDRLRRHKWPGNVRELRRAVRQAVQGSSDDVIQPSSVHLRRVTPGRRTRAAQIVVPPEGKSLDKIEAEAIEITLRQTQGNKSAAARILGVSRPRLQRKIEKYGLSES